MRDFDTEPVFDVINSMKDEYIKFWCEFCDIESPSADKNAVDKASEYVINKARLHGWKIETLEQKISGNPVCITMNPDAKGKPIALSGHVDTVHPIGLFGKRPTRTDGEYIYGPGVTDCKGGIVSSFLAMHALEKCGYRERPVLLLLQTDEEVSSRYSNKETINWICEKARDCVAFLNTEPYEPGFAILERKGILRYAFTVYGQSAHSSACANNEGEISAIAESAYKIIELEKLKDPDGLTCNCGVIKGGSVANTVPGECRFEADIRFANAEQMSYAEQYVQRVAQHQYLKGSRCEVKRMSMRVAMEKVERNYKLLERLNEIFVSANLSALEPRATKSGSDAADVTEYGIPTVDCLGVDGLREIHSPNERSTINSLIESAKRLASAVIGL